jgi:hypothetical protein
VSDEGNLNIAFAFVTSDHTKRLEERVLRARRPSYNGSGRDSIMRELVTKQDLSDAIDRVSDPLDHQRQSLLDTLEHQQQALLDALDRQRQQLIISLGGLLSGLLVAGFGTLAAVIKLT